MFDFSSRDWYTVAAIVALTLSVIVTRAVFLLFGDSIRLSSRMRAALRFAPLAALTAIIVPALLPWHAGAGPAFDIRLLAALAGTFAYLRTRSAVLVIVVGMLTLWGLRWLGA